LHGLPNEVLPRKRNSELLHAPTRSQTAEVDVIEAGVEFSSSSASKAARSDRTAVD